MQNQVDDAGDRAGRPRWHGFAQLAVILGVIAIALYFARAPDRVELAIVSGPAQESDKPAVSVYQPTATEQALTVKLTGTVEVHDRVAVRSEVVGRVVWVSPKFRNGGSIAAHERIITVDPTQYELQVEAATMAVKAAEARVWVETSRAEQETQSFSREHPGADIPEWVRRVPFIAKAEAERGQAQAALKLAELELKRTNISFPYNIRVATSDVSVGELVGPAEAVIGRAAVLGIVYRPEALQVDAPVELKDLEYLDPVIGRSAHIRTRFGIYEATVVRVSSVVAPQTRLASLFFKFSEAVPLDSLPLPNTFVEVLITGPVHQNVYVLPESVMQERDSVWIVNDGALNAHVPRAIGRTSDGIVVEAFDAGDGIVVGTLPGAREGLEIVVMAAAASG